MNEYNEVGELQAFQEEIKQLQIVRGWDKTLKMVKIEQLSQVQYEIWLEYKKVFGQVYDGIENERELLKNLYGQSTEMAAKIKNNYGAGDRQFHAWMNNRVMFLLMNLEFLLEESDETDPQSADEVKKAVDRMKDERGAILGF